MENLAGEIGAQDGKAAFGFTRVDPTNRFAHVYLHEHIPDDYMKQNFMGKHCMEYVLVHELCHIVLPYPNYDRDTLECSLMWEHQHQKVEQFARALIKARYDDLSFLDCFVEN